jgi:hypothetical protein
MIFSENRVPLFGIMLKAVSTTLRLQGTFRAGPIAHALKKEKSRLEGGSFGSVRWARGYWLIFLALFFDRLLLFTAFLAGPPALSI